MVVDNDGLHPPKDAEGSLFLDVGTYPIKVEFLLIPPSHLKKDHDTAKKVKKRLDINRQILRDELGTIEGAKLLAQGGGMFVILDTRPLGISSMEFCLKLLDQQGVSVLPCDGFGLSGRGLVRISLCESEATTREAVRRIHSFVKSL